MLLIEKSSIISIISGCIITAVVIINDMISRTGIIGDDKVSDEDMEIFNSFVTAMQNAVQEEEEELMKEKKSKHSDAKSDSNDGYAKDGEADAKIVSIEVGSRVDDQLLAPLSSTETVMEQKEYDRPVKYVVPLIDESSIIDDISLVFDLSTNTDSKEMDKPLSVCIMCSVKDKEIVELKELNSTLVNEKTKAATRITALRKTKKDSKADIDDLRSLMDQQSKDMEFLKSSIEFLKSSQNDQNIKINDQNIKINDQSIKINDQNIKINSLKTLITSTQRLPLRLLIHDARDFIAKQLGRPPLVGADKTTILWNDYMNGLTVTDLAKIGMSKDLIQFIQSELRNCNVTAHKSSKLLVAATLINMDNSNAKKGTWKSYSVKCTTVNHQRML